MVLGLNPREVYTRQISTLSCRPERSKVLMEVTCWAVESLLYGSYSRWFQWSLSVKQQAHVMRNVFIS